MTVYSLWNVTTVYSLWNVKTVYSLWNVTTVYSLWNVTTVYSLWNVTTVYSLWNRSMRRLRATFLVFSCDFGDFAKLRKAAISFFMSVCPSVCKALDSYWTDFHEIRRLNILRKSVQKFLFWLKFEKIKKYFTRGPVCIYGKVTGHPTAGHQGPRRGVAV
jgi:hypothetical protein